MDDIIERVAPLLRSFALAMFSWLMHRDARAVEASHERLLALVTELTTEQYVENLKLFRAGIISDQISLARIDLIEGRTTRLNDAITDHAHRLMASMCAVPTGTLEKRP